MEKQSILNYSITGVLILLIAACTEEFLNRPPEDSLTIDNFYKTDEQVMASTAGLYGQPWFELNDKALWTIGDALGGNHWTNDGDMGQYLLFTVNSTSPRLNEAWNGLFRVIVHSNMVINNVPDKAGDDVSETVKLQAVAEAKFMRATAYFYLVRLWGPVPIIEDHSAILEDPQIPKNTEADVYRFIIMDLEDAMDDLPGTNPGTGRVSSWSAKGMLAKVYLARSGLGQSGSRLQEDLDKAKQYASDVYNNSGLALMANYGDLFRTAYENSDESLFALQWVACLEWGTQNTNQAYWAKSNELTGTGDGWGGYIGPTIDLQAAYEEGDLRRKETIMQDGDYYPELMSESGGYTFVARPGDDVGENACHAAIKKYVIGTPEDNDGQVCFMSCGINTYILRLADVYLVLAEAILGNNGSTSDAEALEAYNLVRDRAGLDRKSSVTLDDIYHERRIELAYEADAWFDLVRLHYWDPDKAISTINNQERGSYYWDGDSAVLNSIKITANDNDFKLPIPITEVDQNPKLSDDPVPYNFGD